MNKFIIGLGTFTVGVILENKCNIQEKAISLAKDGWEWLVKKVDDLKEDVKENIDDIKENISE